MGRPSENKDHPLQYIRVMAGMTQDEFAATLGISKSEVSKRETRAPGFEGIPSSLLKKVAHEFGAVIDPRPGRKPTAWGGKVLTKEYITKHRQQRLDLRLVKYPPAEVIKALYLAAEACVKLRREELFAHALEQAVKNLCVSVQLRHEIRNQIKKVIGLKQPEDITALVWLAGAIEDRDLTKDLPTLPTIGAHQKQVEKQLPGVRTVTKENLDDFIHEQRLKGQGDFEDF
jgi:transcriptional regulator with XRE-family HTH domain